MHYAIQIVGDDELPQGRDRVIVEREGRPPLMLISREVARGWLFMRAYEDTLEPCTVPSVLLPAERPMLHAV